MSVYHLNDLRVVDLTKTLNPKTETRRCGLTRFNTGGPIPDYHTIMDLTSHLGTHVECPYHHHNDWADVQALPLTSFMGPFPILLPTATFSRKIWKKPAPEKFTRAILSFWIPLIN